jgi:hypothetical protein
MIPVFGDFETYYDKDYSLKKMSTQAYIWDPQFKVHGVGLTAGKGKPVWVTGAKVQQWLEKVVPGNVWVCHNANFDAAILAWRYGLRPKLIVDTVSLSRAIIGERLRSHALGSIAEYLLKETKGGFLAATMGVRDLSPDAERQLAEYCLKDTDLCRQIFYTLIPHLPKQELLIMDMCSRMFTEPKLWLDNELLQTYHSQVVAKRLNALDDAGVEDAKEVRSNPKFAELLRGMGVEPPMKESPTTGEQTFAFAKTDEGMMALAEHPDERVQALVAARLQNRSTLAETRCEAFMNASRYGEFPIPYLFSGAMTTHRWSGGGGMNLQNLPRGGDLRKAIMAPPGFVLFAPDLSQIELRITLAFGMELARMAGNDPTKTNEYEALQLLAAGGDLYSDFGTTLFNRPISRKDAEDRHAAKECVLGSGFQMGSGKLVNYLQGKGIFKTEEFCRQAIGLYRARFPYVKGLWKYLQIKVKDACFNPYSPVLFEKPHIELGFEPLFGDRAIKLPGGLHVKYPNLSFKNDGQDSSITYDRAMGVTKLFGGKILENIVQATARQIMMEKTLKINRLYPVTMSTHDEAVPIVPIDKIAEAEVKLMQIMTEPLPWWPELLLGAEIKYAQRYGDCK